MEVNKFHMAIRLLNENKLSVVSKDRQIKNGTIMVQDDFLGTSYTIHSSGYARKRVHTWPYWSHGESATPGTENNHYQLNKTKKVTETKYEEYWGKERTRTFTQRILLPGEYLQLAQMVVNAATRERERAKDKPIFYTK